MGLLFLEYLDSEEKIFVCKNCCRHGTTGVVSYVHLASALDLLSKAFHSRSGPAYLFSNAVNVRYGALEERDMTTGRHVVRDLCCVACDQVLGWKYEHAFEEREKYKEGKVILERIQLLELEPCPSPSTYHTVSTRPTYIPESYGLSSTVMAGTPLLMRRRSFDVSEDNVLVHNQNRQNSTGRESSPYDVAPLRGLTNFSTPPPPELRDLADTSYDRNTAAEETPITRIIPWSSIDIESLTASRSASMQSSRRPA